MRGRSALLAGLALFALVFFIAGLLGRSQRSVPSVDDRASTFVTAPGGASALYQALPALGVRVERLRDRPALVPATRRAGQALAVIAPQQALSAETERALVDFASGPGGGTVIVAADPYLGTTAGIMDCLGYRVQPMAFDSLGTAIAATDGVPFYTHGLLAPRLPDTLRRSPFEVRQPCSAPAIARVDTLLTTARGPVMLQLTPDSSAGSIILVADASLFRNRALRATRAGPFVLGLLANRYSRVVFDEYDHGFGPSGSLGRTLVAWSLRSPLGWGIWQAVVVGLLALLAAGVRFGPPIHLTERKRRASREQVHALATALAAARGHDVAISALVRGLHRRLTPLGRGRREDESRWLESLAPRAMTPRAREAVQTLTQLAKPGQNEAGVLRAAQAVEDVWDTLRQPTLTTWPR